MSVIDQRKPTYFPVIDIAAFEWFNAACFKSQLKVVEWTSGVMGAIDFVILLTREFDYQRSSRKAARCNYKIMIFAMF